MSKKILFITSEFPPLPGGIGNHAFLLSKNLQINNYLVKIITNHRSKNIEEETLFDDDQLFEVIRIKRYKLVFFSYLLRVYNAIKHTEGSEIIIASGKFSLWTVALAKVLYSKKKTIAVIHGSEVNRGGLLSKKMTFWSLNKMDKIIAVSQFTKDIALIDKHHLKIQVIHNGFELKNFDDIEINLQGSPSIITIGNVSKRKGQHNFIKAIPNVLNSYPELHYHMVGLPSDKKNLTILAQKLEVSKYITFHGMVSEKDKYHLLSGSKIFLMLSDVINQGEVEGFGIAILEANSLGIPAIGSKHSGISEAIKSGFNGILVNPNKIDEIEQAIKLILADYPSFSINALEWSKKFNWNVVVKKYIKVLES